MNLDKHPLQLPCTSVAKIMAVAMADKVADNVVNKVAEKEVDEEYNAGSTNAHTAKLTTIPPKHAD
jgi:hypothetical protein